MKVVFLQSSDLEKKLILLIHRNDSYYLKKIISVLLLNIAFEIIADDKDLQWNFLGLTERFFHDACIFVIRKDQIKYQTFIG